MSQPPRRSAWVAPGRRRRCSLAPLLAACAWPRRRPPGRPRGRLRDRARSSRSRPRSRTKKATWSTAGSSPTCAGSPQRFPIYVTDGYSGPLPNGEHVGCHGCHVKRLRPLQRARRRHRPARLRAPAATRTGAAITRLARWAEPRQNQPAPALPLGRLRRRRRPRLRQPPAPLLEPRRRRRSSSSPNGSKSSRPAAPVAGRSEAAAAAPQAPSAGRRRHRADRRRPPLAAASRRPPSGGICAPAATEPRVLGWAADAPPRSSIARMRHRRRRSRRARLRRARRLDPGRLPRRPGRLPAGARRRARARSRSAARRRSATAWPRTRAAGDLADGRRGDGRGGDRLNAEARTNPAGAADLQLGYLLGAAQRGAEDTDGIHAELVRRLDRRAARYSPGKRPLPPRFLTRLPRGLRRRAAARLGRGRPRTEYAPGQRTSMEARP